MPPTTSLSLPVTQLVATAVLVLLSCFQPGFAQESSPQLIPLQDYISQNDVEKDPAALSYVASRCSALYGVFAKGLEGETAPERQKAHAEWIEIGEKFMGMATRMTMAGTTISLSDALVRVKDIIIKLGNIYSDRIEKARVLTNNMFTDPIIFGDFNI